MQKMEHWLEAGAKLGWLIAPGTESVYVFAPGQPVRPLVGFDQTLDGGPLLPGFALELSRQTQLALQRIFTCPASF